MFNEKEVKQTRLAVDAFIALGKEFEKMTASVEEATKSIVAFRNTWARLEKESKERIEKAFVKRVMGL